MAMARARHTPGKSNNRQKPVGTLIVLMTSSFPHEIFFHENAEAIIISFTGRETQQTPSKFENTVGRKVS